MNRAISALDRATAGLALSLATGSVLTALTWVLLGTPTPETLLLNVLLVGAPSAAVVFLTLRTVTSDHPTDVRRRTLRRGVRGAAFLTAVLVPFALHPASTIEAPWLSVVLTLEYGALGGLLVGTHEARTVQQARAAERARTRSKLAARDREELRLLNRFLRHNVLNGTNVIGGYARTLLQDAPPERRSQLQTIAERADELAELVDNSGSLLETLSGDVELRPVPVAAILESEAESVADTGAVVSVDAPADARVVAGPLLPSVFRHLLHNAVEHNDTATPHVEVSVDVASETVVVRVADDGPGIPRDERESLSSLSTSGGKGFGLPLVRLLVDHYGGDIEVESNDPRGTVVAVELPRATGAGNVQNETVEHGPLLGGPGVEESSAGA